MFTWEGQFSIHTERSDAFSSLSVHSVISGVKTGFGSHIYTIYSTQSKHA